MKVLINGKWVPITKVTASQLLKSLLPDFEEENNKVLKVINGVLSWASAGSGGYDGDPEVIEQTASYRFVTDAQIAEWESKAAGDHNHNEAYQPAGSYASASHNHDSDYEPKNINIQAHVSASHAPSNAQKNSDITKAEIEAKLTGALTSHTHDYAASGHNHAGVYAPLLGSDDNYVTDAEKVKLSNLSGTNSGDQDLSGLATKATTITINGDTKDLGANRSWTVTATQPDIPLIKNAPATNQIITAGYGAYVPFMYELVNSVSLEIGAGSYLEIG